LQDPYFNSTSSLRTIGGFGSSREILRHQTLPEEPSEEPSTSNNNNPNPTSNQSRSDTNSPSAGNLQRRMSGIDGDGLIAFGNFSTNSNNNEEEVVSPSPNNSNSSTINAVVLDNRRNSAAAIPSNGNVAFGQVSLAKVQRSMSLAIAPTTSNSIGSTSPRSYEAPSSTSPGEGKSSSSSATGSARGQMHRMHTTPGGYIPSTIEEARPDEEDDGVEALRDIEKLRIGGGALSDETRRSSETTIVGGGGGYQANNSNNRRYQYQQQQQQSQPYSGGYQIQPQIVHPQDNSMGGENFGLNQNGGQTQTQGGGAQGQGGFFEGVSSPYLYPVYPPPIPNSHQSSHLPPPPRLVEPQHQQPLFAASPSPTPIPFYTVPSPLNGSAHLTGSSLDSRGLRKSQSAWSVGDNSRQFQVYSPVMFNGVHQSHHPQVHPQHPHHHPQHGQQHSYSPSPVIQPYQITPSEFSYESVQSSPAYNYRQLGGHQIQPNQHQQIPGMGVHHHLPNTHPGHPQQLHPHVPHHLVGQHQHGQAHNNLTVPTTNGFHQTGKRHQGHGAQGHLFRPQSMEFNSSGTSNLQNQNQSMVNNNPSSVSAQNGPSPYGGGFLSPMQAQTQVQNHSQGSGHSQGHRFGGEGKPFVAVGGGKDEKHDASGNGGGKVVRSPLLEDFRNNRHRKWELTVSRVDFEE
jgi:hypothetical protein